MATRNARDPAKRSRTLSAAEQRPIVLATVGATNAAIAFAALTLGILAPSATRAGTQPLANVPGASQLQSDTGQSVQTTCQKMAPLNGEGQLNGLSQQLFFRCRELVQTAPGTPKDNTLGLTDPQLNGALQQVATEESAALGSRATQITTARMGNVVGRLAELRRGVTGFRISLIDLGNQNAMMADNFDSDAVLTGGAASGDLASEGRLSGFLNVRYGFGKKDASAREDGYDFDNWGVTGGMDYRLTDDLTVGGAVSYSKLNADFKQSGYEVSGGSADSDGWGILAYGTYSKNSFYVDGLLGYGQVSNDLSRRIFYVAGADAQGTSTADGGVRQFSGKADPNSTDFTASLGAGFDYNQGALNYGPYARLTYYNVEVDSYSERGTGALELAMHVQDQSIDSFTSALGARLAYAVSQPFGVLIPQGFVEWIHEYSNDARTIEATYIYDPFQVPLIANTNDPDRDYASLGVGISAVLPRGMQMFLNYQAVLGFSDLEENLFVGGIRAEF